MSGLIEAGFPCLFSFFFFAIFDEPYASKGACTVPKG